MTTTGLSPRTAAAERLSLGAVLGERNVWLLFVLGLASGLPGFSYWFNLFPRVDLEIDRTLGLSLIGFGATGWIAFAAAPFLDRYGVPGFARLGRRKSWVAAALCAALALIALHVLTALASEGAALRLSAISGVAAMIAFSFLWIAVDALRIELYRGRAQAVAMAAQYLGALTAAALAARFTFDVHTVQPALIFGALLAVALGAVVSMKAPAARAGDPAASLPALLARPWTTFFARHGSAAGFLLGALALYALAGSAADFLGKQGYLVELLRGDSRTYDPGPSDALAAASTQEIAFTAIGVVAGMLIAYFVAPARAFFVLMLAYLGLLGFFLLCKVELGFTVFTVAGSYALRTLIYGVSAVIYFTIVARLTAPPDTAGHVAILALVSGVPWLSETAFAALAPTIGGYGLAAGAALAALGAIACMRRAARAARRAGN